MVWVPIQMVGSALGGWISFECHTEAQPKAISYWARDHGSESELVLMPNARIKPEVTSTGYRTHMKLTIQHLEPQDIGNYRCVAKNSLGEAEGSVRLIGTLHCCYLFDARHFNLLVLAFLAYFSLTTS